MTQFTDETAAAARGRSVIHASAAGALFQGVYALSQMVILAALMRYLGPERFGMWTTIWSIAGWGLLAHLGLHSALLTRLGQAVAQGPGQASKVLTTTLLMLVAVTFAAIALVVAVGGVLPWSSILNVHSEQAIREAAPVTMVALLVIILGVPAAMGGGALLACQRGRAAFTTLIAAHLTIAAAVILGVWLNWSLTSLTAVALSPPILAGLMQWVILLRGKQASLSRGAWDRHEAKALLRMGLSFFVLQLMTIGLLQTGSLIIAQMHGAEAVPPYAAVFRLVGLVLAIFLSFGYAYWPAFGDAAQRGDHAWFGRAMRWSLAKTATVWGIFAVGIALLGDRFILWWLGPDAVPDTLLTAWMVGFIGLYGLLLWIVTPLNGIGRIGVQVVSQVLMVVVFIPLAVWLCGRYGAAGVPIAQAAVVAVFGLPINGLYLIKVIRGGAP